MYPGNGYGKPPEELNRNLQEVIEMLLEEGEPLLGSRFIGTLEVS